ncbi:MAG: hypothetical protein ACK5MA_04235 [Parachlamydiaceae bacterium]
MQISKVGFFTACLKEGLSEQKVESIWQQFALLENEKKSNPFALSFIDLAVIYVGIVFQRNRINIENKLLNYLPSFIRTLFSTTDKT